MSQSLASPHSADAGAAWQALYIEEVDALVDAITRLAELELGNEHRGIVEEENERLEQLRESLQVRGVWGRAGRADRAASGGQREEAVLNSRGPHPPSGWAAACNGSALADSYHLSHAALTASCPPLPSINRACTPMPPRGGTSFAGCSSRRT